MLPCLVAVVLAAAAIGPDAARAEQPAQPDDAEARRLYEEGLRRYRLGDYEEAIADLKASYQRVPAPALLYDLAQVYRLERDCAGALGLYRDFLASKPSDGARERTEKRIAEMARCVADQPDPRVGGAMPPPSPLAPAPRPPAPPPVAVVTPPAAPAPAVRPPWWGRLAGNRRALALTAATAVLATACGYFAWQTVQASNQVSRSVQPQGDWDRDAEARGRRSEALEIATGAGALLAGATAAWLTFHYR